MMEWYNWFSLLGGSALLGAVVVDIYTRFKKDGKKAMEKKKSERVEEEKEFIKTVVNEVMAPSLKNQMAINKKLDDIKRDLDANKSATITGLRTDLMLLRDRFRDQGFSSPNDKAAWNQLYKDYADLGGNHFKEYVDQWKEEVNSSPNASDPTFDRRKNKQ